uniref:Uncharacterized protein n=1 Tax=Lactuca sativa TaxID=4236 RepID=A0A9R1WI58_LACSA|nr:hypothetical protein LSAT_V11C100001860 [Lactuca sativa]
MKEKVSEQLEKYFFNLQYEDYDKPDQKLIQLLSLETEECEELYKKEPQLFHQYFKVAKVNKPDTESEQEDNPNINAVKFEYSDSNKEMEAESSYTAADRGERKKKKKYEFKMSVYNGIPNSGKGPNTINVLNIDCIPDFKLRERVIEKWVTEISLILQTNPDEFGNAKNILLLLEHKTDGIVQKFLRNNNWNKELHGLDLFDSLINVIYTTFLGIDYVSNKDFTINKKVDIAKVSMTKLQLHDICLLDKYTCRYESYLYDIPQRNEYSQWISTYLMKIPIIGEICTKRWKKEAIREIQQTSLSYATKIAKEEIDRICQDKYKQKKLKTISKDCCNILSDFKDFDIGRKTKRKNTNLFETQKKSSKEKQISGTNITQEEIIGERIVSVQTTLFKQIEDLLEKVCSENPIDPEKTKGWMKASIKLINPKTIVREQPMVYSPQDREEFSKQIKELLDMRLIKESKSPHMSPVFFVNKEAEKRRGKKRMVVNYKAINDATIGDSHNLPNMHELLTLL